MKTYFKLKAKSTQNGGSRASLWGVRELILEEFWRSGRPPAAKCLLGGVSGGFFQIFKNLKKNLAISTKNWLHLEGQDDLKLKAKTVKNSMRQSFVLLMTSKIDFGWIFCRFWQGKWSQVGIKMKFNIDRTSKSDFMRKP